VPCSPAPVRPPGVVGWQLWSVAFCPPALALANGDCSDEGEFCLADSPRLGYGDIKSLQLL